MVDSEKTGISRRQWLCATSGLLAAQALADNTRPADMPAVDYPRATSGDTGVEPGWEARLTVTVGREKADLCGTSDKVIQAAADYVARLGGGTVQVLPGEYRLRNSIFLPSGVRIVGSGLDSVLSKEAAVETTLEANSDWYDQEVTLADASGFEVGDGICLITENPHHGGTDVVKRTLVARSGNRFKLDKALRKNYWVAKTPRALSLFPLITAEYQSRLAIENIALDGNRDNNPFLNGNYSGCIWFQDCDRITLRKVTARNQNGDGISWQIGHDVLVEGCHAHDNAGLGLHPGSGSQRSIIRNNRIERNKIGLFFCWGATYGLAEKNQVLDSGETGISIGHRDNGNLVRENEVRGSGKTGILFREEREGFAPTANRIEGNRIVDNGAEDSAAVDIQGQANGNTLAGNAIRETRAAASRIGIRVGASAKDNSLIDNTIEGFAVAVQDLSKG